MSLMIKVVVFDTMNYMHSGINVSSPRWIANEHYTWTIKYLLLWKRMLN